MKKSFADILIDISSADFSKMKKKVPEWADIEGLRFPTKLCTEQCSSSETAMYKASLFNEGLFVADLTGGLGVDAWAYSLKSRLLLHNEMNVELSEAVEHNYKLLGITNAIFTRREISPGMVGSLFEGIGFPDVIFMDPARRDDCGKKVFLLEDCRPDILTMRDELLDICPKLMVKLSPMADISMICKRLGEHVKEVHVVAAAGECKELVVVMDKQWSGDYEIVAGPLRFKPIEERLAHADLLCSEEDLMKCKYLFEPSSALLKSGAFNLICSTIGVKKLGRFTHLYVSEQLPDRHGDYLAMGKWFSISEFMPFNGGNIKVCGKKYPQCGVTARNLPVTSDSLRKRMGVSSGSDTHIFAVSTDLGNAADQRYIIVTERIYF